MNNLPNDMINVIISFCDNETLNNLQCINKYFYFKVKVSRKQLITLWRVDREYKPCSLICIGKFWINSIEDELAKEIMNVKDIVFHLDMISIIKRWHPDWFSQEFKESIKQLKNRYYDLIDDLIDNDLFNDIKKFIDSLYNRLIRMSNPIIIMRLIDSHECRNFSNFYLLCRGIGIIPYEYYII